MIVEACQAVQQQPETFWSLMHSGAHWAFELFLMAVVDGIALGIIWPFAKKHLKHHLDRDKKEGIK